MNFSGYGGAGLLVSFVAGLFLGWWTSPGAGLQASDPAPAPGASVRAEVGLPGSRSGGEAAPVAQDPSALLEAALEDRDDDPRFNLIRLLARLSGDPGEVVGMLIDSLSEEELIASVSSFTDLAPEKFKRSADPKALAHRLAQLAMDGLLQRPGEGGAGVEAVYFSEGRTHGDPDLVRAERFFGDEPILAAFPMGDYEGDEVFVKWTRLDDPKIMLFNHYPIRSGEDFNYVWLSPKAGWDPGEYEVNFYTADESLLPLAGGRYSIDSKP